MTQKKDSDRLFDGDEWFERIESMALPSAITEASISELFSALTLQDNKTPGHLLVVSGK